MFVSVWEWVAAAVATPVCLVLFIFIGARIVDWKLPPGPRGIPLIGSFFYLKKKGLQEIITESRKIYGDIFSIRVFEDVYIVCSGYQILKELLIDNGSKFCDKPSEQKRSVAFQRNGIIKGSGELLKQDRKFDLSTLRDLGIGKNRIQMEIRQEMEYLLDAIDGKNGEAFDIQPLLHNAAANVISRIVFGERFDYDDAEFSGYVRRLSDHAKISTVFKTVWFQHLPSDPFRVRGLIDKAAVLRRFYKQKVQEHFENYDGNNTKGVIDAFIKRMKMNGVQKGAHQKADELGLIRLVHELFSAGTGPTASALTWGLVYLIRDEEVQSVLHKELDMSGPEERLPVYRNMTALPFLQATILEIYRLANVLPYVSRWCSEHTSFQGYKIPESAQIIVNMESVLCDSELWDEPCRFKPSRFLDSNSSVKRTEKLPAFGFGPKTCVGEALAKMEIHLFLAAMLQRFKFCPPEGQDPPSLDSDSGIVRTPSIFKLRAIRRNN